jgi:hypothetical protein
VDDWWWPHEDPADAHWPPGIQRIRTLESFRLVFAALGYSVCPHERLDPGFVKVAVFANPGGVPTHVARQLSSGRWTSKLGRVEDIEHDLHDLEGALYGAVALIMQRPDVPSEPTRADPP